MSRLPRILGSSVLALAPLAVQGTDVISRELSARVTPGAATGPVDVVSRELCVRVPPTESPGFVSRELSVRVSPPAALGQLDVVSRELSVRVAPLLALGQRDVVSREVSARVPAPDLVASTPAVPSGAVAGTTIQVDWGVTNLGGNVARAPWNDVVVLSPDAIAGNGDDVVVSSQAQSSNLAIGGQYPRSDLCALPTTLAGTYHAFVVTDYQSDVYELGAEANNTAEAAGVIVVSPAPAPDLAVTDFDPPPVATDGELASVSWTVENLGTLAVAGAWQDRVYLSADANFDGEPTDILLGTYPSQGANAPGETYTQAQLVTVPAGLSGDYWFIVQTDDPSVVTGEASETNNLAVASAPTFVYQPDKPNLEVTSLSVLGGSSSLYIGNPVTLSWTVTNTDTAGTANGAWVDRVYLSPDATLETTGPGADPEVGLGGFSGARGPGESYLQTATLTLPSSAHVYYVFVVTDADDAIAETDEADNTSSLPVDVKAPEYGATLATAFVEGLTPGTVGGLTIPFTGTAIDTTTMLPAPNVPVTVRVHNKGTRRVFQVQTDATGAYTFDFLPVVGEAGLYKIWADHPAVTEDPSTTPPLATFRLLGVRPEPAYLSTNLVEGETKSRQVQLKNLGDTTVTGIQVSVGAVPPYLALSSLVVPTTLAPGASAPISFDLTALADPAGIPQPETIALDVSIDVNGASIQAATLTLANAVSALTPQLVASVPNLDGTMVIAGQTLCSFTVTNVGGAIAKDVMVATPCIPNADGSCIVNQISPLAFGDMAPGESREVELALLPASTVPVDTEIVGSVDLTVDGAASPSLVVPFHFVATSTATGSLALRVEDEATYWSVTGKELFGTGPLVAGADVSLTKPNGVGLTYSGTTDASGTLTLSGVVEGSYLMRVTADGHGAYQTLVQIGPGQQTAAVAFVPIQSVTYQWSVVPTAVPDEYQITITAVFQTTVPVPKVSITPSLVDLDLAVGETRQVTLTILNEGLVTARGVELEAGAIPDFTITPLLSGLPPVAGTTTYPIGDLGANQSVDIPVLITRLAPRTTTCPSQVVWGARYYIVCGQPVYYFTPLHFQYPSSLCGGGVVGGVPSGTGSGSGGSGSGGGSSVSPYTWQPTYVNPTTCQPPPAQSLVPAPGFAGEGSGDVYPSTGEAEEHAVDYALPGRGPELSVERTYLSRRSTSGAFGNGWTFNLEKALYRSGPDVVLLDGEGRIDVYEPQPDGSWARDEMFHSIHRNTDGTYTVLFPDLSRWDFLPVDASLSSGKLLRIADPEGNALTMSYDALGRLDTATDALGRSLTFSYNADGTISTVTDSAGRTWTYAYYQDGDPNGASKDLKSVTTPPVYGNGNGVDFALGKTTTYTYSTGFQEPDLNHNLLTVTDPRGVTVKRVTYHPTTDPVNRDFDRVVRVERGDSGTFTDYYYLPVAPTTFNRQTVLTAYENDPVGNVTEYDYDSANRLVAVREYTGRADATQPTTQAANRPGPPLHSGDPPYFETVYQWNEDALPVRRDDPDGTWTQFVYESALDPSVPARVRGNLREVHRQPGTHTPIGDQALLSEYFEYESNGLGRSDTDWLTRYTDPRGNVTTHEYDAFGNRTRTIYPLPGVEEKWEYDAYGELTAHVHPDDGTGYLQRDEYEYYAGGRARGFLWKETIDVGGLALTTERAYDARGNVIRFVDGRGNDTLYTYDSLDEELSRSSRAVTLAGTPTRAVTRFSYDGAGNLVEEARDNFDASGVPDPALPVLRTTWAYDGQGDVISVTRDVSATEAVTSTYAYDGNRNRTLELSGVATSGVDPDAGVRYEYDERDLLLRETHGIGSADPVAVGPSQSTTQYDYDGAGRVVRVAEGLEDPLGAHVTAYTRDAYGRVVLEVDPMGNTTSTQYDANGNAVLVRVDGALTDDVAGGAGNVRLEETLTAFDALDRPVQEDALFFDPATQLPLSDGARTTVTTYSPRSQVLGVTDDNLHTESTVYDTAGRVALVTDPKGNTVSFAYDANSNVIQTVATELSDLGSTAQVFTTSFAYDELDRLIARTDNAGWTTSYAYDSRDNRVIEVDARGNRVERDFDGLDRPTETRQILTDDGTGAGSVLGAVTTTMEWDAGSRLVGETDDTGFKTVYAYDSLDRLVQAVAADGTAYTSTFDVHGNEIVTVDANGTVVTSSYDGLDRVLTRVIQPAVGISPSSTFESYQYDGRSRVTRASDDDSVVVRAYDSLSNLRRDVQVAGAVSSTHDAEGNVLSTSYPRGRTITRSFDALDRVSQLADGSGSLATFWYRGPERLERIDLGNGTARTFAHDALGRTTDASLWSGATLVLDRQFAWDAASNKWMAASAGGGWQRDFTYDSLDRLVGSERFEASINVASTVYTLDGAGSRLSVLGRPAAGAYGCDGTGPEPADCQVHQYTSTPLDTREYDANGNLVRVTDGALNVRVLTYDFADRLVGFLDGATGKVVSYRYDALGRRFETTVDGATTRRVFEDWQVVEELDASGGTLRTFVFGDDVDALVSMDAGGQTYFAFTDDQGSVLALTDGTGSVAERYEFDDFGLPLDPVTWLPLGAAPSALGNPYLFTGRRFDPESSYYDYRERHLDPWTGTFLSRDPLGIWGDEENLGNPTTYVGNAPWSRVDPYGERGLQSFLDGAKVASSGRPRATGAVADRPKREASRKRAKRRAKRAHVSTRSLSLSVRDGGLALSAKTGQGRGDQAARPKLAKSKAKGRARAKRREGRQQSSRRGLTFPSKASGDGPTGLVGRDGRSPERGKRAKERKRRRQKRAVSTRRLVLSKKDVLSRDPSPFLSGGVGVGRGGSISGDRGRKRRKRREGRRTGRRPR